MNENIIEVVISKQANLNYIFENFVIDENNRHTYEISRDVAHVGEVSSEVTILPSENVIR